MDTRKIGNFGERIAENYLRNKGYQILDKNYSFRMPGNPQKGEIDIIAKKNAIISFIEVKTLIQNSRGRTNSGGRTSAISPEEKVNFGKQRKLRITAESWLMGKKIPLDTKWQIDVVAIEMGSDKKVKISHFENAIPYQ